MTALTKSQQVENYIRKQIYRGDWKPGERIANEPVIGSELGVSYMTVKTALTRLASEGLLERRQGLGTYVARKTKLAQVAVLARIDYLSSPNGYSCQQMVDEARKLIDKSSFSFLLSVGHGDCSEKLESSIGILDSVVAKRIQGVLSTMSLGSLEEKFNALGIPCVSIIAGAALSRYCVVLNFDRLIELGTMQMKAYGYDGFSVMYLEPQANVYHEPVIRKMHELHLRAVEGDSRRLIAVPFNLDNHSAYDVFKRVWSGPNRPRAIFFTDDMLFDVASRAIVELGIKVPEDLAIVTHSNLGRKKFHFSITPTLVEFDLAEAVAEAWKMLNELIRGHHVEQPIVQVYPKIREGRSLG